MGTILVTNKLDIPPQLLETLKQHSIPYLIHSHIGNDRSASQHPAFLPYNRRISVSPLLITYPSSILQIQALVQCIAPLALKITVRSGGHSYAAHGLGGSRDGAVVIDMRAWQNVTLNEPKQDGEEAVVGAGVRLGNLAAALYQLGQRGLPHGTCPLVGLGGHALYGGFGLSSRMWGLTVDNILSVSGILADGTSFTASATQNCDLFWALRGAGPSFAIVTEMTLRTYLAPECVIVWEFIWYFPLIAGPGPPTKAFMKAQEFAAGNGPVRELGFGVRLEKGGFFKLYGAFFGQQVQFESILNQLGSEIDQIWDLAIQSTNHLNPGQKTRNVFEMGYMEALSYLAEGIELENSIVVPALEDFEAVQMNKVNDIDASAFMESLGPGVNDCFFAKSLVQPEAEKLTYQAVFNLLERLHTTGESTPHHWFIIANLYGGGPPHRSSVISSPTTPLPLHPTSTSCYPHRECLFVFQFYASATQKKRAGAVVNLHGLTGLVNGMVETLQNSMPCTANWGQYAPYVDATQNREAAERAYYDSNGSLKRLKELKAKWDPHDTFWCETGVIPASAS